MWQELSIWFWMEPLYARKLLLTALFRFLLIKFLVATQILFSSYLLTQERNAISVYFKFEHHFAIEKSKSSFLSSAWVYRVSWRKQQQHAFMKISLNFQSSQLQNVLQLMALCWILSLYRSWMFNNIMPTIIITSVRHLTLNC